MRVLLLTHRFAPHSLGGVEVHTATLADALTEAGHGVAVLTMAADVGADVAPFSVVQGSESPVAVHRIRHRLSDARTFRETWGDDRFRRPIGAVIDGFAPDVVHVGHPDGWGVIPFREAGRRGIPTTATLHDPKWFCGRGQMVRPPGVRCEDVDEARCVRCLDGQLARDPLRALAGRFASPLLRDLASDRTDGGAAPGERPPCDVPGASDRVPCDVPGASDPAPGGARASIVARLAAVVRSRPPAAVDDRLPADQRPDPGPAARRRWRARQAGLLRALRDAHAVVAPSRFLARRARELGLDRDVVAIPNGLAAAPGSSAVSPERPPGPLSVGFFGNPHPTKGLDLLLRAFASLPAGAAELHVHGTSDASGPGVVAHGRYAPADAVGLMRTVDVVAIPSTWAENHPLVALEARAAGRPLLVADLGGLPELVAPGRDGWIVPPDDPEAWGERLALLAATLPRVRSLDVPPPPTAEAMAEAYLDVWRARPSAALSSPESRQKGR